MSLNKSTVKSLVIGTKKFLNANYIERKKIEKYYKNLVSINELVSHNCSLCPLNNKFGKGYTGCNSFMEDLSELGEGFISWRGYLAN